MLSGSAFGEFLLVEWTESEHMRKSFVSFLFEKCVSGCEKGFKRTNSIRLSQFLSGDTDE